ncbi:branched-chain amino acid ABC transporter substrate-binding protein [Herbaspirillum sp. DW155]|uniref:branched-chain amino acid ABC transporter substrate-binding protein n=1 Tax=Herbaspirillum sp. DW155 TaxID=3095609 RepID=UPI0030856D47|nr:branched-chain amino acid ABC transporter substrate-binding protein [Herbaspirillum sp. DW155]
MQDHHKITGGCSSSRVKGDDMWSATIMRAVWIATLLLWTMAPARSEDSRQVTLGLSAWLTQPIVQSAWRGAELAVEDGNALAARKKSSYRFRLLAQDDQGTANFGVNVARYFIKEKVAGVIGPWSSDAAMATAELYEAARIPQISFTAGTSQWTSQGNRMPFRVVGGTADVGAVLAQVSAATLKGKRVFIIHNDSAYSNALTDELAAHLIKHPGLSATRYLVGRRSTDFNAAVKAATQYQADVLVFLALFPQASAFVEEVRRTGLDAKLLLVGGASSLSFGEGELPQAHVLEYELAREHCPRWKAFTQAYVRRYNAAPSPYSYYAYDATSMMIAAIEQAGSTDGEKIAATLHRMRHAGLSGPISFTASGANAAPRFRLYQYHAKGQWRQVGVFPPGAGQNEKCL